MNTSLTTKRISFCAFVSKRSISLYSVCLLGVKIYTRFDAKIGGTVKSDSPSLFLCLDKLCYVEQSSLVLKKKKNYNDIRPTALRIVRAIAMKGRFATAIAARTRLKNVNFYANV